MDRLKLSRIDERLDSSEVAALCFLCHDVLQKKSLEGIRDARSLFRRLEDKGLLENDVFLSQLFHTIRRTDLLKLLNIYNSNSIPPEETDSSPILSNYRVMLYRIYEDMTRDDLEKMKFLLSDKLPRRKLEMSNTPLDVFAEMEKASLISNTNVNELRLVLQEFNQKLATTVRNYCRGVPQQNLHDLPHISMDNQRVNNNDQPQQPFPSVSETEPSFGVPIVSSDAHPRAESIAPLDELMQVSSPQSDVRPAESDRTEEDFYQVKSRPAGLCVIINNEHFMDGRVRMGTNQDAVSLAEVFSWLGFRVLMFTDQTKHQMERTLMCFASLSDLTQLQLKLEFNMKEWMDGQFTDPQEAIHHGDAFICCILSHGARGSVLGTDLKPLSIKSITLMFKATKESALTAKPKVFVIQACQGKEIQQGVPVNQLQSDDYASQSIPEQADVLVALATVEDYKAIRHIHDGSWFVQSLCHQLRVGCPRGIDITRILHRVNNEVSKKEGAQLQPGRGKQTSEFTSRLTKTLVLLPHGK